MNGKEIVGKKIEVLKHSKKNERGDHVQMFTNLYVTNMPASYTLNEFQKLFTKFGTISSITLNEKTPGSGFISFADHDSAKQAMDEMHMKKLPEGQAILVNVHVSRKDNEIKSGGESQPIIKNQQSTFKSNVFVKNVPASITDEKVKEIFSKAGAIASVRMQQPKAYETESTNIYRNYFVLYEDVSSAQKSIQLFDQDYPFGKGLKQVRVDFWQPKEERKNEMQERQQQNINTMFNELM